MSNPTQAIHEHFQRARVAIVILTVIAFILRSPKFLELRFYYAEVDDGSGSVEKLMVDHAYLYNEELYTYIVTGSRHFQQCAVQCACMPTDRWPVSTRL